MGLPFEQAGYIFLSFLTVLSASQFTEEQFLWLFEKFPSEDPANGGNHSFGGKIFVFPSGEDLFC